MVGNNFSFLLWFQQVLILKEKFESEIIFLVQDKLYIPLGSTTAKPLFKSLITALKRKASTFWMTGYSDICTVSLEKTEVGNKSQKILALNYLWNMGSVS